MIEGLRVVPWLQQANYDDPTSVSYLTDCDRCKRTMPMTTRQMIGCGYAPAIECAQPWRHPGMRRPRLPRAVDRVCAGYLASLPQVEAASLLTVHWERGTLAARLEREPDVDDLEELEVLHLSARAVEGWVARNARDKAKERQ